MTVDQKVNGGKWNLLGTYAFDAGATTVTLTHPGALIIIPPTSFSPEAVDPLKT